MKINESLWQFQEILWNFKKIWWNYEDLPWTRSGRMYQTSVNQKWSDFWYIRPLTFQVVECIKSLIHSTTDVPSGRMYQIWWKSIKICENPWSNVSDFRKTSDTFDHWRSRWSNVSDLMKIYWKFMTIHENNRKSDENRMNINETCENLTKTYEYLMKCCVSDFRQTFHTFDHWGPTWSNLLDFLKIH